jgi:glycosyltransferase involved in cell wall biosynthesis
MSRFPKLTETFVAGEMLAVMRHGVPVEIYPLLRGGHARQTAGAGVIQKLWEYLSAQPQREVMHPEVGALVEQAHYQPFLSWPILGANWHFLWHQPRAYLGTLWRLVRGGWGSRNYLCGGLAIYPKSVYLAHRMLRDGITHLHAHFANHPATSALIISRLSGIPFSFTAHGSDLHRDRHLLREKVAEASFVVAISNYNRQIIVEECPEQSRGKVVVIHCGVNAEVFRPCPNDESCKKSDGPISILCIGTLHEVKGQRYLIEACRMLRDWRVDFALHFVGDGPDRIGLEQQVAQAGLTGRVVFHGRKNSQQIARLLRTVDILAAPSVPTSDGCCEGIPVVLMEAMASGVAVVASRISGIPELVDGEQSGLLVPPRDPLALARALQRLQGDADLRRRLGEMGREKVQREFNVDASAALLAERFRNSGRRRMRQPRERVLGSGRDTQTRQLPSWR